MSQHIARLRDYTQVLRDYRRDYRIAWTSTGIFIMLTDRQLRNLKSTGRPHRVREKSNDDTLRGFGVQVSAKGSRSFFTEYTFNDKRRFFTLGQFPGMSLADARKACRKARKLIDAGIDPQMDRERRRTAEAAERKRLDDERARREATATVKDLLEAYLDDTLRDTPLSEKTIADVRQTFAKNVIPYIGGKHACDVTEQDIRSILNRVKKRGAKVVAHNLHGILHAAFSFGYEYRQSGEKLFRIETNPVGRVKKPAPSQPGMRELKPQEIRELWNMLDAVSMEPATKTAIRLLLATGQRVEEILHASWEELDFERRALDIPASRLKTGKKTKRGHVIPLTGMAINLFQSMPRIGPFVFPKRHDENQPMPFRSLSQAVDRICKTAIENDNNPQGESALTNKFTPRDIRRTVKTRMAEIGVFKEIRDRVQNHALQDVASQHYDRYDYLDEKRQALEGWEWELTRILQGRPTTHEWEKTLKRFVRTEDTELVSPQLERILSGKDANVVQLKVG